MMIEKTIELIALVLVTVLFTYLLIHNVTLRLSAKKAVTKALQAELDKLALYAKIEELNKEAGVGTQGNDGFLKFLSESRSAAFQYIEEVQAAISEFDNRLGPVVKHYKETGKILHTKPSELVKELSSAYDKLMASMPKENEI